MAGLLINVPADEVEAWYDQQTHTLNLRAVGKVGPNIVNIRFEERYSVDALSYALVGRHVYGIPDPLKPYEIVDHIPMGPPLVDHLIIATANFPRGKIVPIVPVTLSSSGDLAPKGLAVSEASDGPKILPISDDDIHVLKDKVFKIVFPSHTEHHGSVSMTYDDHFVQLVDAGIRGPNIEWKFKALALTSPNSTTIALYVVPNGGLPSMYRVTYNVYIAEVIHQGGLKQVASNEIESFLAFVKVGIDEVKRAYPDAQLYRVTAKPSASIQVNDPKLLTKLTLECDIGDEKLTIQESISWGVWTNPKVIVKTLGDVVPFPWKDSLMSIEKADQLMKDAGWKTDYTAVKLENFISPTLPNQPYYVFEMVQLWGGPSLIFVGTNDGEVIPYPETEVSKA